MKPTKGIAFDLEGTVVNLESAHHNAKMAVMQELGISMTLERAYAELPHFVGGPDEKGAEDIWKLLDEAARVKVSVAEIQQRSKAHFVRLRDGMDIMPRPGFMEFYAAALKLGLRVSIGSLTAMQEARLILEKSGLDRVFDPRRIVLREHVQNLKPAPDVFLKTAELMGVDPENQLVFEDSPRGVTAAISAGSRAIGMPPIWHPDTVAPLMKAGAVRIFRHWGEIDVGALMDNLGQE